jgi:hypothetical protein
LHKIFGEDFMKIIWYHTKTELLLLTRFRHCKEARRGNLFVFSFNSWDYLGRAYLLIPGNYFY